MDYEIGAPTVNPAFDIADTDDVEHSGKTASIQGKSTPRDQAKRKRRNRSAARSRARRKQDEQYVRDRQVTSGQVWLQRQKRKGRKQDWYRPREYNRRVSDELRCLASIERQLVLDDPDRAGHHARLAAAAERQAKRARFCGSAVVVTECRRCTHPQPGTARHIMQECCHGRFCSHCSRIEQSRMARQFELLLARVPEVPGYAWQALTVTYPRTAGVASVPNVAVLTKHLRAFLTCCRKVWNAIRTEGAGMYRFVEINDRALIHAHAVYYGPPLIRDKIAKAVEGCLTRTPSVDIEVLPGEPDALRGSLKRWANYCAKGGARNPSAVEVERHARNRRIDPRLSSEVLRYRAHPEVVSPALAAAWQLATFNQNLRAPYGVFRGIRPEPAEPPPASPVGACVGCGGCEFTEEQYAIESVLEECHLRRQPAFSLPKGGKLSDTDTS